MITHMLHTLTDISTSRRGKFVTISLWLFITIALMVAAPKLASLYNNASGQSIPSGADSQVAQHLLLSEFPASRGTPAILVFYDPHGLSVDDRISIKQVSDWLTSAKRPAAVSSLVSVFTVPQTAARFISQDGTTMTMIALLNGSTNDQLTLSGVKAMRYYLRRVTAQTPLQAYLTGPAGILTDAVAVFSAIDLPLLLTTIGLVFVLLIVLYRSPILALLPLIAVGIALSVVNALLGFGARAGFFPVTSMSTSIATVLLFGAGTDYSVFIASRYREELLHNPDRHIAMQRTMRAVGEAITSSAGTVILALLTLLFAALGLYNSLGPTLAIVILVMLFAGLTLVPALLVWVGRAAYWPFVPHYYPEPAAALPPAAIFRGFWGRLGQWTARHRILAVVSSTLLLTIFALGNIGSQPSFNFLTAFRVPTDSAGGYTVLQRHFPAGTLAPTTVLLEFHGGTPDAYQHLAQLDAITAALQNVPNVALIQGPTRPDGTAPIIDAAALQANIAALPPAIRDAVRTGKPLASCNVSTCPPRSPQFFTTIGAFAASNQYISPDNTTVQLSIALKDDPYSLAAIDCIPVLHAALIRALEDDGLGQHAATRVIFHLAGQTSLLADTLNYNSHDTYLIVPAVLLLVFLVLALLLRSLVAPLYLLGAVTLNFLAAIGVCSFFFQRIQGEDGFNYAIPLYTFIFLVALGADYTIFLMSRVREEAQRHGLEQGVPLAASRTGGVITSAGLILAGTFLVLTSLPLTILYQLGVCVAVGILLDTFVVRGLLVPGLVLLLGRWNWWPGEIRPAQRVFLLLALIGILTGCGANPSPAVRIAPTQTGEPVFQTIPITAIDYNYVMPNNINVWAGLVDIVMVNNGAQPHQTQVARLNSGVTRDKVLDELITQKNSTAAFSLLTFIGGPDIIAPGYGQETILKFTAGQYVMLCLVVGEDGIPHIDKGMIHFFTVSPAQTQQESPPPTDGEVVMKDSGYVLPSVITQARNLTLQVLNQGFEPHELNIVKLAKGRGIADIVSFFQSPSGPPPFEETGGMAALAAGGSGWMKIHLEPGNYAVLSFIPDRRTGKPQYTLGMISAYTVG